jgi:hypothetical protein
MGLTINYEFEAKLGAGGVRELIETLQTEAAQLDFADVGEVQEFQDEACEDGDPDDPHRWLKIQAGRYITRGEDYFTIVPVHIIAFATLPGPGSEAANFGLCRYPETIAAPDEELQTGLSGWSWSSFCKTQYASNPAEGGLDNFLRCHLAIINLLDEAHRLGILKRVVDEGEFWEKRDPEILAMTVDRWNKLVAGFTGKLKDKLGQRVQSAIMDYPNFEHLEAESEFGDD